MKKETEETKTNLNKLKDNVQTIVKKIKEEFTTLKNETGTGMEDLKKEIEILKANPVAEVKTEPAAEVKANSAPNDDLTSMKKETEEIKINLNKLKDNVQNVVKKIKEEMTANKTEIHTELDKIKSDMFA